MAEWLGNGLQNRGQQFESAWYLKKKEFSVLENSLFFTLTTKTSDLLAICQNPFTFAPLFA